MAIVVLIGVASAAWVMWPTSEQATTNGDTAAYVEEAPAQAPFNAADFKWPTLIEHLHSGSAQAAVTTDEAVFILYYLREMNTVFGDPDMKVFIAVECFTKVYDAEMTARLQSVFWTKVLPRAVGELGSVVADNRKLSEVLAERYPILAGALHDLSREVPEGTVDRLFILGNLPRILSDKAKQDALTLFSTYGCESEVTSRIYSNAVKFVKAYNVSGS